MEQQPADCRGELPGGAIAAFPPPHSFFGARESNQVLGDNYYRKDSDAAFNGNARAPIRVALDAADEPSVAIADYQSESDEDAQAREREETKRLLYVALTRARDRLYLSATVQKGVCRTTRGSLGEMLPRSLVALFAQAGSGHVTWAAQSGRAHAFNGLELMA